MLRITVVESSSETVRLRVEGRVTDRWVEELRRSCEVRALGDGIRLTLDLGDVSFVDTAGIELLKELRVRCVTLLNPSPFVAERLKGVALCGDPGRPDPTAEAES
jgi:anti-anti-sigma regulatory factor